MRFPFVKMRQVLKYPGAKNRVADWIISYMPRHNVYLEVFAGSAAVLLNKERCHIETINDLDGEIINFFQVLRDRPDELIKKIRLTPFGRDEYKNAFKQTEDAVEQARRYTVRCWQGFGNSQLYHNGFKSGQQSNSPNPARAWAELPHIMDIAVERLRGVQIENLPAVELIQRYNTPDVFIYADPPYYPGTRKSHLYKYEMDKQDHVELLTALLEHPGPVMISGYDNETYNQYLKGWRKVQKETLAEAGHKRTETLWMNYKDNQITVLDYMGRQCDEKIHSVPWMRK